MWGGVVIRGHSWGRKDPARTGAAGEADAGSLSVIQLVRFRRQSPRQEPKVIPPMPIQPGLVWWLLALMGTQEAQASNFEQPKDRGRSSILEARGGLKQDPIG